MLNRVALFLITAFWVTMNVLLWRAEFGSRRGHGDVIPPALVWQKIVTAPDSSALVVLHHGRRIGFCQLSTGIGDQWATVGDENVPPGMPDKVQGYKLHLEGSATLDSPTNRLRFDTALKLGRNRSWEDLNVRMGFQETVWEIHSAARSEQIEIKGSGNGVRFEKVMKFDELRNPATIASALLGPVMGGIIEEAALPELPAGATGASALHWEAREDQVRIAHADVRVYRLRVQLMDRYSMDILVSRVGEIMRVELPDEIILVNDRLMPL